MANRKFPDWATDDIADIGNGDANKLDPGTAKQESGWAVEKPLLQNMNWLQNLFGHFIRANNQVASTVHDTEVEAGERILANNLTSSATIKLPTDPEDGQWVEVGGAALYSTNSVVVDGGTLDIMVPSDTTCTLDEDRAVYVFWWSNTLSMWRIRKASIEGVVV